LEDDGVDDDESDPEEGEQTSWEKEIDHGDNKVEIDDNANLDITQPLFNIESGLTL